MMKTLARQFPKTVSKRTTIKGFTLIELLTVIAIIGILAAIIIPTVGKVRDSAKKAQCVSNLKQIGMCIGLYLNENKNMMPYANAPSNTGWDQFAAPLPLLATTTAGLKRDVYDNPNTNHIFNCPADRNYFRTYTANGQFMVVAPSNPDATTITGFKPQIPYTKINSPSTKIIITDCISPDGIPAVPIMGNTKPPIARVLNQEDSEAKSKIGIRHGGKANALYADFHVNTIDRENIDTSKSSKVSPFYNH
jgi:prepilin-type N-terminal cleavage/methylation domain-containing protein/prepilin-type processing-associated H-X9-DG protein